MENICQSCGIPLTLELAGTNADARRNMYYCYYCFDGGEFMADCTMEEMVDIAAPNYVEVNPDMTIDEAKAKLQELLPTLGRWKD